MRCPLRRFDILNTSKYAGSFKSLLRLTSASGLSENFVLECFKVTQTVNSVKITLKTCSSGWKKSKIQLHIDCVADKSQSTVLFSVVLKVS